MVIGSDEVFDSNRIRTCTLSWNQFFKLMARLRAIAYPKMAAFISSHLFCFLIASDKFIHCLAYNEQLILVTMLIRMQRIGSVRAILIRCEQL